MTALLGIDVSKWQVTTPSLAGLSFLFARASVGLLADTKYAMHIANARAAGLMVGAYHFAYGSISISGQAAKFLDAAGDVDFYVIDVEGGDAPSHAQTATFIAALQAAGKRCGLYASDSVYFDAGQDFDWVARWSPTAPSRHWDFWQYQGSPLDKDRFAGSLAQLRALAQGALLPALTPPDTSTGDTAMGPAWEPVAAVTGTITLKIAGNLIDVATGDSTPVPKGYVRNVYARVSMTGSLYNGQTGYLATSNDRAVIVMGFLGAFKPATEAPADCKAAVAAAVAADRGKAKIVWP